MNATYDFDKVLDRTKRALQRHGIFGRSKPGAIPMNGAETHFECPAPVRKVIHDVADWPIYGYPYFTDDFVNAAAGYMKRQHGWDCDPKWIEFVGGIVPGIAFAIQAVTAVGDKVLINSPAYSPFRSTVEMNDRVLVESMLNITPEEVTFDWEDMERKFSDPAVKAFTFVIRTIQPAKAARRRNLQGSTHWRKNMGCLSLWTRFTRTLCSVDATSRIRPSASMQECTAPLSSIRARRSMWQASARVRSSFRTMRSTRRSISAFSL